MTSLVVDPSSLQIVSSKTMSSNHSDTNKINKSSGNITSFATSLNVKPEQDVKINGSISNHNPAFKTTICTVCKKQDTNSGLRNRYLSTLKQSDGVCTTVCPNCVTDFIQHRKSLLSNKCLLRQLNMKIGSLTPEWKMFSMVEDVYDVLERLAGTEIAFAYRDIATGTVTSPFKSYIELDLKYYFINLRGVSPSGRARKSLENSLKGSRFESVNDYHHLLQHVIPMPPHLNFGIVLLPNDNFFMIMKTPFMREVDFLHRCFCATRQMHRQPLHKRSGAASGVVTSDTNSSSLPKVCRENSIEMKGRSNQKYYFSAAPKGVGASILYQNDDGSIRQFKSVYNDITMYNRSGNQIVDSSASCIHERMFNILEEIGRLQCMIILFANELLDKDSCSTYLDTVRAAITTPIPNEELYDWVPETSDLERGLLCASQLFEMDINYSSLCSHVDGNRGSKIEVLGLLGKLDLDSKYLDADNGMVDYLAPFKKASRTVGESKIINEMKSGYLFLPMDGLVIKLIPGKMLLYCNFDATIHTPDEERGIYNFSTAKCKKRNSGGGGGGGGTADGNRLRAICRRNRRRRAEIYARNGW